MSKYIIDTGDYLFTTDGVLVVGFDCDNKPATFYNSLDNLEELNSDYINEHFGELQDEAYQKGINDGSLDVKQRVEGAYQRGLEDAWEAARKVTQVRKYGGYGDCLGDVFGRTDTSWDVFDYSASEAIEKIQQCEQEKEE